MGRLVVTLGTLPVLALPIRAERTGLGRAPDNEIVLSLPDVADHHAELQLGAGGAVLRALGEESLLLNGRSVEEGALRTGDRIQIGGYVLQWEAEESDLEAASFDGHHPTSPLFSTGDQSVPPDGDHVAVREGPDQGRAVSLSGEPLVLGRAPDCDLVLRDETVSWRHASIEPSGQGLRVRDLSSRNGTFLDGHRVESAIAAPGNRVRIGRTVLEIVAAQPDRAPEPPAAAERAGLAEMVGSSPVMREVYRLVEQAAPGRVPVLLLGETGTGKELAARAVHSLGPRSTGPFIPVNCAAIPREMLEDELFGHARGAFTGADAARRGAFELADGGTIFLDEIAEMPPELQPKLLRILEDDRVQRVGGGSVQSDFRLVAATNRDLEGEIAAGRFRQDLYYRLAVLAIRLPPLRERCEDLPDLLHHFLRSAEELTGVAGAGRMQFDEDALEPLAAHAWPGNVRELRNVVLRAVVHRSGGAITRRAVEKLLGEGPSPSSPGAAPPRSLGEVEREAIENALRDCGGRRRMAARRLGIAESTLYEKIRRYKL